MMKNRRGMLKIINRLVIVVLVFCLISVKRVQGYSNEFKKILILNSYHSSDPWEQSIIEGVKSELDKQYKNIEYKIEYLDMRKDPNTVYLEKTFEFYKVKFSKAEFDLIIACDNDAFNFLDKYHNDLFNKTPIIFVGVNNFKESEIKDRDIFAGVAEEVDIRNTIDIGLKLHKDIESVNIVLDYSSTSKALKEIIEGMIPFYSEKIRFNFIQSSSLEDIKIRLSNTGTKGIVFAFGVFKDEDNHVLPIKEGVAEICKNTVLPVYSCWDFLLGDGIVGGVITKGEKQGNLAAQVAIRILNGESPSSIPIIKENMNSYYFDYNVLKKFNIQRASLPDNSIVVNEPLFP